MATTGEVWVWRPGLGCILKDDAPPLNLRHGKSAMVSSDIEPYRSVIDGTVIGSRSHHRTHLQDHGCVELGNDRLPPKKTTVEKAGADVKRAVDMVKSGHKPQPVGSISDALE